MNRDVVQRLIKKITAPCQPLNDTFTYNGLNVELKSHISYIVSMTISVGRWNVFYATFDMLTEKLWVQNEKCTDDVQVFINEFKQVFPKLILI